MKTLNLILSIILVTGLSVFSQKTSEPIYDSTVSVSGDEKEMTISIDNPGERARNDTTNIIFGKKRIAVSKNDGQLEIKIKDSEKDSEGIFDKEDIFEFDESEKSHDKKKSYDFDGHWSGFEWGFNDFLSKDFDMTRDESNQFMKLHTGRSWNINVNLDEYSMGFEYIGMVTGLGLEFNDYRFDNNNNIREDSVGNIIADRDYPVDKLDKSKLSTVYLTVPLLIEGQIPLENNGDRLYISTGVIGGLKIGSHSKVVFWENGEKHKRKNHDDFNLSPLRYGFTVRMGYKFVKLYANYYPTALFQKEPELYPFSVGLTLVSF